jgi:hypothetical protein
MTIVGIEEHTALIMDFEVERCRVMGVGGVTVIKPNGEQRRYTKSRNFAFAELGDYRRPDPAEAIPPEVWSSVVTAAADEPEQAIASKEILALVEQRQAARSRRDWQAADDLRVRIEASGWQVQDTREGPILVPL